MSDHATKDSYDREKLIDVLVYHQRSDSSGCICGWGVLGESHAVHVADVYEMVLREDAAP